MAGMAVFWCLHRNFFGKEKAFLRPGCSCKDLSNAGIIYYSGISDIIASHKDLELSDDDKQFLRGDGDHLKRGHKDRIRKTNRS